MKNLVFVLLITLCLQSFSTETREGIATDLKSGKFLYKEVHRIEKDKEGLNKKITSMYLDSSNKIFATMTSDFSKNKVIPETKFEDIRFNIKQEQSINEIDNLLELIHFFDQKKIKSNKIKISERVIAGQGFDNFIKLNFNDLKDAKVQFAVLDKLDFYNFVIDTTSLKISTESEFVLKINSFFASLLVSPIKVSYEKDTKTLVKYTGTSNILSDSKKYQEVQIVYRNLSE